MRILVLLLLLANLAFFAWERFMRTPVSAEEHIRQVQMTPEKIKLVKAAAPAKAAAAAPAAVAQASDVPCLEWGTFLGPEAARADAAIAELGLPAARVRRVASDAKGYWVLIPPLPGKAEIDKAMETLKAQGVGDFTLVTEPPQKRNAISLGIFRSEEAAQNLLTAVRKKGFADVVMEPRENFFRQVVFYIREPGEAVVAKLAALRAAMPGTEVKAMGCPPQ
jgi:hypothetical protein